MAGCNCVCRWHSLSDFLSCHFYKLNPINTICATNASCITVTVVQLRAASNHAAVSKATNKAPKSMSKFVSMSNE
jgi:hypothetical protein